MLCRVQTKINQVDATVLDILGGLRSACTYGMRVLHFFSVGLFFFLSYFFGGVLFCSRSSRRVCAEASDKAHNVHSCDTTNERNFCKCFVGPVVFFTFCEKSI